MRNFSDLELKRMELLTKYSIEFTTIEPTANWLNKAIMDATWSVRNYLKDKRMHNYEDQGQWQESKIKINTYFILSDGLQKSSASLYRPNTKKWDPRIWFTGLKKYADPNDILWLIAFENEIYVINLTQINIELLLNSDNENQFKIIASQFSWESNTIANELLEKLRQLKDLWPIESLVQADTWVGATLEHYLWIDMNSSKQPDYKGIELKAFRLRRWIKKNLFAQVPSWNLSKFKSSAEILSNFWYNRNGDFKLYCTVSAIVANSQWLSLRLDTWWNKLFENSSKSQIWDFVVWELDKLHSRLQEKHNETFWITAKTETINGKEYFTYTQVEHTKWPILSQFDILVERWIITVDHLIKKTPNGRVSEKWPLFKIKPNALGLLFPPSTIYSLEN